MTLSLHNICVFIILGHFTQIVWKESKKLGIGKAQSSSGKIFVVANYDPAGNWKNEYVANVPRPKT